MIKLDEIINCDALEYNWSRILSEPYFKHLRVCREGNGTVLDSTISACSEAINFCKDKSSLSRSDKLVLLASTLFLNIGKAATPPKREGGETIYPRHEIKGEKICRRLLWGEGCITREKICSAIRNGGALVEQEINKRSTNTDGITGYMLIGLPGAGKSTLAEKIKAENTNTVIISRDELSYKLGFIPDGVKKRLSKEKENILVNLMGEQANRAVEEGHSFVIDAINLTKSHRDSIKSHVSRTINWSYIYVEADSVEKNIERRKNDLHGGFDLAIMEFDWPLPEEYDEFNVIIT